MKIAIRVLLFIILLNSLLFCGWLSVQLIITHANSKKALSRLSGGQRPELLKIPVCALDKDQSDEVWFGGNLFDVVKRERIHDTVYVYIFPDKDEQDVLDIIFDHFRSEDRLASDGAGHLSRVKTIPRALDWHYILRQPEKIFHSSPGISGIIIKGPPELNRAANVLTPPPRGTGLLATFPL